METKVNVELFDRIIEKQLDILRRHGAEFIVKKNNGDIIQHGDSLKLHVEPPPQEPKKKKTYTRKVAPGAHKAVFGDIMECMMPGDEYTFDVPEELEVEGCRAAACGYASHNWGNKTYTTSVNNAARQFTVRRNAAPLPSFSEAVQRLHDEG